MMAWCRLVVSIDLLAAWRQSVRAN